MNIKHLFLAAAIVTICTPGVFGQNFFWSTSGFGDGAVNGDFKFFGAPVGTSGTAYLYYDAAGTQNITEGFDIDLSWDVPGRLAFTAAESLEFDITIASTEVGVRWGDFAGPAGSVTPNAVTDLLAVNVVNGEGIQVDNIPPGSPFIDEGYDESAGAFLVGYFDWTVVGTGEVSLQIDSALVVDNGQQLDIPFRSFSINIPEPTSCSLIAISAIGLVLRRRR